MFALRVNTKMVASPCLLRSDLAIDLSDVVNIGSQQMFTQHLGEWMESVIGDGKLGIQEDDTIAEQESSRAH